MNLFQKLKNLRKYPYYIDVLWSRYIIKNILRRKISIGNNVHFYGLPIVSHYEDSMIEIGDNCVICSKSKHTSLGVNHPVVIRTLSHDGIVKIGNGTGISGATICAISSIIIGENCLLGANVMIVDNDFHQVETKSNRTLLPLDPQQASPVNIENNVFIGTGSIILKGVRIGQNSVIGACSVVTKNIPPNSVVAGNPAVIIKSF